MKRLLITCLLLVTSTVSAQPDLSGVLSRNSGTRGYVMSQWYPGELPFSAAGRAQFDANIPGKGPRQTMPAFGNDPLGDANPPGLYRTLVYGRPWEFIQLHNKIVQIFEWGKHWRTIWLDEWGTPFSDFAQIEERWRRNGVQLELTITVNDPDLYSEPWTSDIKTFAYQSPDSLNGELMEQIFAPIDEIEFNRLIRDPAASGPVEAE